MERVGARGKEERHKTHFRVAKCSRGDRTGCGSKNDKTTRETTDRLSIGLDLTVRVRSS